jgi:pyrimidine deaminase RibD-like protein
MDVWIGYVIAVQAVEQLALEFLPQDGRAQAIQDQEHSHSAGVHYPCRGQGVQLVLGADHGSQGTVNCGIQGQAQGVVAVVTVLPGVHRGRSPGCGLHD